MTLIEYRNYFRSQLKGIYTPDECDDFLKRLMLAYFEWESIKIGLEPNYKLTLEEEEKLNLAMNDLKKEKPLQYILGTSHFMNLDFEVNPAVLIPRPETEELVNWVLEDLNVSKKLTVLDIGTGSGCIPISLKKALPDLQVSALDVSEKALEVAQRNAKKNNVAINFYHESIFDKQKWSQPINIVISNPPYVVPSEKVQMKPNVLDYEPELALFVPEEEPLLFYKQIIDFSEHNLTPEGALYFEINPIFVNELREFFEKFNFNSVEVRNDYLGRPRMMKATKS